MLTRFGYFLRETLISLRRNLLMTIAGIMTVTVSLALFGGIQLLSKWVDHGTEVIKGGVRLEIFMNVNATETQIGDVRTALESDQRVKTTGEAVFLVLNAVGFLVQTRRANRQEEQR